MTNLNDLPEFLISSAGLSDECASKWGLKLSFIWELMFSQVAGVVLSF